MNIETVRAWDMMFLSIAETISIKSKCVSRQVCALAVRDHRIVATGLNGTINGFMNCCDKFTNYNPDTDRQAHHAWSMNYELHAEDNLMNELSVNSVEAENTVVYINLQPCQRCALRLANLGVSRIVYSKYYDFGDLDKTAEILNHSGVKFEYINLGE